MTDYAFLKTGLGDGQAGASTVEVQRQMMSLCVALVSRAGACAATYAEHAGRSAVVAQDVQMAMQYQAKVFMDTVDDEEVVSAREDVDAACDAESSTEDDVSTTTTEDEEETDDDQPWTESACSCEVCTGMHEARDTWETWAPEDEVLKYLKARTTTYLETQKKSCA